MPEDTIIEKSRTSGTIRRIVLDRAKCIGARSCAAIAPGVFQMDDQNLAYIVDPNSEDDDTVLLAAQSCPVLAILLYDQQGKQIFPEE
jgi:ferredoxin